MNTLHAPKRAAELQHHHQGSRENRRRGVPRLAASLFGCIHFLAVRLFAEQMGSGPRHSSELVRNAGTNWEQFLGHNWQPCWCFVCLALAEFHEDLGSGYTATRMRPV